MREIEELLNSIEKWIDGGGVGNFVIYHPPKIMRFGVYTEETIKAHELNDETREALETLVSNLGAVRGEFFTKEDGTADRVKVVRSA